MSLRNLKGMVWIAEGDDLGWMKMNFAASAHGFEKKGYDVRRVSNEDVEDLDLIKGDVFHGTVGQTRQVLGEDYPDPIDYPDELRPYMGRKVSRDTLGEFRPDTTGIFVKPVQQKAFTGVPIREKTDWLSTEACEDGLEVIVSDLIDIASEWRAYVDLPSDVSDLCRYNGQPLKVPHEKTIEDMISSCEIGHPYALDVAVTEDGETVLVEVNDMMTAGNYGIDPLPYSSLIENRWRHYWENQEDV